METATVQAPSDEAIVAGLWQAGSLRWLLHDDQARVYDEYREWQLSPGNVGLWRRLFVFDCARRWGKDVLCLVIKIEDAIRQPESIHTYATAFAKDISDIVIPLMREITATCPEQLRPRFHVSQQGESMGFYFQNGSTIKLVGIDRNPDGLRGRYSDGVVITEAAFVDYLWDAVVSVIYPQFQGRDAATIILQSTAPKLPGTAYDDKFIPDAKLRHAYVFRTIDDNPMVDAEQRQEWIDGAGGRDSSTCRREYYGERVRDHTLAVVPEYDEAVHVKPVKPPEYADCYVGLDPGMRDLCAILWGYWDFERAKLCIQRDWAERNTATAKIAEVMAATERNLWTGLTRWDGTALVGNPYMRVSDVDARLLGDLQVQHSIAVQPTSKDDKEAALHALRDAFLNRKIEIDPCCTVLRGHLGSAQWNASRTDYQRSETFGHFDAVDALIYLWRNVVRTRNPKPPDWFKDNLMVVTPQMRDMAKRSATRAFDQAFKPRRWHPRAH